MYRNFYSSSIPKHFTKLASFLTQTANTIPTLRSRQKVRGPERWTQEAEKMGLTQLKGCSSGQPKGHEQLLKQQVQGVKGPLREECNEISFRKIKQKTKRAQPAKIAGAVLLQGMRRASC